MNMHYRSQGGGSMASLLALLGLGPSHHLEDSRSVPLQVTYSMWYRSESDYMPRLSDPRIGYFTQDHFSLDRFDKVDREKRYIARFNLKKREPGAKLSPPIEPIVWYIDHSVPERFRPAIRDGILSWNRAFEQIGFKDALVVKDAPKDEDWDHAASTRNLIRWVVSEKSAYAVAWFRQDPLTGEVLNAAVNVDANYPSVMLKQHGLTISQARSEIQRVSRANFLKSEEPSQPKLENLLAGRTEQTRFGNWQNVECQFAEGLSEQASMAWTLLQANGSKVSEDDFMFHFMSDLIAHEVGHCLGLRHNFAGSTNVSTNDLLNDNLLREVGVSASVMDYTAINTVAVDRGYGVFFNEEVGPYDLWAIEYGYSPIPASTPEGERYLLNQIAKRSGEPGHLFLTDEDADGINPLSVRYDLGSDTLAWIRTSIDGNENLRSYAATRYVKTGEGYGERNRLIIRTYERTFRDAAMAGRFIGGVEMRRHHRGDVLAKPTLAPVPAKKTAGSGQADH